MKAADQAFVYLIDKTFEPTALGFIGAAGISAALSTAAGILITQANLLSGNIYQQLINPKASEKTVVLVSRISVLIFAVIGVILAVYCASIPSLPSLSRIRWYDPDVPRMGVRKHMEVNY